MAVKGRPGPTQKAVRGLPGPKWTAIDTETTSDTRHRDHRSRDTERLLGATDMLSARCCLDLLAPSRRPSRGIGSNWGLLLLLLLPPLGVPIGPPQPTARMNPPPAPPAPFLPRTTQASGSQLSAAASAASRGIYGPGSLPGISGFDRKGRSTRPQLTG